MPTRKANFAIIYDNLNHCLVTINAGHQRLHPLGGKVIQSDESSYNTVRREIEEEMNGEIHRFINYDKRQIIAQSSHYHKNCVWEECYYAIPMREYPLQDLRFSSNETKLSLVLINIRSNLYGPHNCTYAMLIMLQAIRDFLNVSVEDDITKQLDPMFENIYGSKKLVMHYAHLPYLRI